MLVVSTVRTDYADFTGANDTIVVLASGAVVPTGSGAAVYGNASTLTLLNQGSIVSGSGAGVQLEFGSNNSTINNSGLIYGTAEGVLMIGAYSILQNSGDIGGGTFGVSLQSYLGSVINYASGVISNGVNVLGYNVNIKNEGSISGGVDLLADYGVVDNSGNIDTITFGQTATAGWVYNRGHVGWITTEADLGSVTRIINTGSVGLVTVSSVHRDSSLDIFNKGIIEQYVEGGNAADKVRNAGQIVGDVDLYNGNDTFNGRGGSVDGLVDGGIGNDTLTAGDGDTVFGNVGNDVLIGRGDIDTLIGGRGADKLRGGSGADTFVYEALADSTVNANAQDTIFNFSHGDKIDLSALDADTTLAGNQEFFFIGTLAFNTSAPTGQLRVVQQSDTIYVEGDVNDDAVADFRIALKNSSYIADYIVSGDFIL
jgi:Ca2+-binding RTX toxin-like protein